MTRLTPSFFFSDTITLAQKLLGQRLVRVLEDGRRLAGYIVETEAYIGQDDAACHASRGRTPRNEVMFGPPGHAYIYFIYGMYYCLNVVSEQEGFPAAVLIRALEPVEGIETMRELSRGASDLRLTSGPGRLCRAMAIDRRLNGCDLSCDERLFLEEGISPAKIMVGRRVGITADEIARQRPWRFYVADNPFVSPGHKLSRNH